MRNFSWYIVLPIIASLASLLFLAYFLYPENIGKALLLGILPIIILALGMLYLVNMRLQNGLGQLQQIIKTLEEFDVNEPKKIVFKKSSFLLFNELNEKILALIDKIRSNFQANKQFTQNASHELQTPLAIIKGHVELLFNSPNLKEKEMVSLGIVLQNTNRLARLNKDLMLLSKIEQQRYSDLETIKIESVIEEILYNYQDLIDIQEIEVEEIITNSLPFKMSITLAEILFTNLFQNAIRYNVENGFIKIRIKDKTVTITNSGEVLDVPPETLFNRFTRQSNIEESLGLGLSIVKKIGELYHIDIKYLHQHGLHQLVLTFP